MTYARWTSHELKRLRALYPISSSLKLAREFYPHPIGSILTTAWALGLRKRRRWMDVVEAHALSPSFNFSKVGAGE